MSFRTDCYSSIRFTLLTTSVVEWSEFLATDPKVRVRFPALPDFLRNILSGTGSTQPREYNWGATWKKKNIDSGLEIREYGRRDPSRWPRGNLYQRKFAITSPTSGGRSAGIVLSRTQATELRPFPPNALWYLLCWSRTILFMDPPASYSLFERNLTFASRASYIQSNISVISNDISHMNPLVCRGSFLSASPSARLEEHR
jgi:hypothetical protein